LQQTTSNETHPEIHVFLNYQKGQWRNSQSIFTDWIIVGKAMIKPLNAIVSHHIIVPDVGAIIIEGDGILPMETSQFSESKDVRKVFIVEEDERQLLQNLRARGRGFNEWNDIEQESFAHASWLFGPWLAQEAKRLELSVIQARPQETLLERLLTVAGAQ